MTPQCALVVVTAADDNWDCGRHFERANNTTPQPTKPAREHLRYMTHIGIYIVKWNYRIFSQFYIIFLHRMTQNNGDASFSYRRKFEDKASSNTNLKDQFTLLSVFAWDDIDYSIIFVSVVCLLWVCVWRQNIKRTIQFSRQIIKVLEIESRLNFDSEFNRKFQKSIIIICPTRYQFSKHIIKVHQSWESVASSLVYYTSNETFKLSFSFFFSLLHKPKHVAIARQISLIPFQTNEIEFIEHDFSVEFI